jgi:hypothetical protein
VAYRISRDGVVIEADTAAEVLAIVGLRGPSTRAPAKPRQKAPRARRGASSGSIEGRIMEVLGSGPLRTKELCEKVKAAPFNVRKALRELAGQGIVRSEGQTASRRHVLVTDPRKAVARTS